MPVAMGAQKKRSFHSFPTTVGSDPQHRESIIIFPLVECGERKRAASLPRIWLAPHGLSSVPQVSLLVSYFHINNYSSISRVFPVRVEGFTKVHITVYTPTRELQCCVQSAYV